MLEIKITEIPMNFAYNGLKFLFMKVCWERWMLSFVDRLFEWFLHGTSPQPPERWLGSVLFEWSLLGTSCPSRHDSGWVFLQPGPCYQHWLAGHHIASLLKLELLLLPRMHSTNQYCHRLNLKVFPSWRHAWPKCILGLWTMLALLSACVT